MNTKDIQGNKLRNQIAKALGLQRGGIPGVKKSAPANRHYYRKHTEFNYELERVTSTSYKNAEEDIDAIVALIDSHVRRARIEELESLRIVSVSGHMPEIFVSISSGTPRQSINDRINQLTNELKEG